MPKKQSDLYELRPIFIEVKDIFQEFLLKKGNKNTGSAISLEKSGKVIHILGNEIEYISRKDRERVNRLLEKGKVKAAND